ncbi:MAG: antirestriction protein [Moraxellaceae bacterium]
MDTTTATTMNDKFFNRLMEKVGEKDRMGFLPSMFDGNIMLSMSFENFVLSTAAKMSEDYTGGSWSFAKNDEHEAFFMYPSRDKSYQLINQNTHEQYKVDGRILGFVCCTYLFSHLSFAFLEKDRDASQKCAESYHNLRNCFYSLIDKMLYEEDDLSAEEKAEIEEMSRVVWSYLD